MMILVVGRPDSGKSRLAEDLAVGLAAEADKLYLATMIPFGKEGEERVKKHRKMRSSKGFDTIEKPLSLDELNEELKPYENGVCLLECVANLAGNEMHSPLNTGMGTEEVAKLVTGEIKRLRGKVKELVVVSDIFEVTADCDEETLAYIGLVHRVNEMLKETADRVYET